MENVQSESCVIERLMGINSRLTQQPVEKCRVFSDNYLQKMCYVEIGRKRRFSENRLSWMETDGPVFDDLVGVSTCSSGEESFSASHPHRIDFSESSNSFHGEGNEKGCTHESELSCAPCFNESSGYSPSTSEGNMCMSSAENDTVQRSIMKGRLDSSRLVQSLKDYLSDNTRTPCTGDKERKLSTMNGPHSFKFRRRIYMNPEKEVAAHTRHVKQKKNLSNSELEDLTATHFLQSHINFQRIQCNAPSSNFNDPCHLRAMQTLMDSWRASKASRYDHIGSVRSGASINNSRESRPISSPDTKLAWKNSTILESLKHNSKDLVLHRSLSTKMVRQKTCSDMPVSILVHPNGLTDDVDQIPLDVIDDSEKPQDSMHALPGIAFDTFLSPEPLSPRSSEEACQHSPVSVLQSSSNAGEVPESDHFKHGSAELQELRMHLQLLETEFPEGFFESSVTAISYNEDDHKELWAQAVPCNVKQEACEINDWLKKELVRDPRWLDLGEEIHAIGTELEILLIDELIEDFIYS